MSIRRIVEAFVMVVVVTAVASCAPTYPKTDVSPGSWASVTCSNVDVFIEGQGAHFTELSADKPPAVLSDSSLIIAAAQTLQNDLGHDGTPAAPNGASLQSSVVAQASDQVTAAQTLQADAQSVVAGEASLTSHLTTDELNLTTVDGRLSSQVTTNIQAAYPGAAQSLLACRTLHTLVTTGTLPPVPSASA